MKIARLSLYTFFALFLLVVSCGKDGGETNPNKVPTSKTQAERVKDLQNSILLGVSFSDLKTEGYTLEEFLLAEVSIEDILTAGFTLNELLEEDITIAVLKSNDITLQQFYDADVPIEDLWEADYTVNELLAIDGIEITDLKSGNVPLQAIVEAGQSVQAILAGGFTVSDLKDGGVPVKSVYDAGVSIDNMMSGGYTMVELLSLDAVTLQTFIENGYTLEDFIEEGISAEDLKGAGYSVLEMYEANMPLSDIFGLGVGVGTLRDFGATENELKAAGLVGSVNDIDNNNYGWVKIGDQIWMSESLRTTRDRDGNGIDNSVYNGDTQYKDIYGRLYSLSYFVAYKDMLCPTDWHIPSSDDWQELFDHLGPEAGLKLKESGTDYWSEGNEGNNISGFSVRGGGYYDGTNYKYDGINEFTYFGTSTYTENRYDRYCVVKFDGDDGAGVYCGNFSYNNGFNQTYIRCVKD